MNTSKKKTLCITMGDPLGIGAEITVKALSFLNKRKLNTNFKIAGSKKAFNKACNLLNISNNMTNVEEFIDFDENLKFNNQPSIEGGNISYKSICKAADLYKKKKINGIVTAPISKESLHLSGHNYDGHTGLLAHLFNIKEPYLMLSNKKFSTLHVTCHKPLKEAVRLITREKLLDAIKIGHDHMIKINKKSPKIAVCGLNPHAGENGIFGSEEINEITPAINFLAKEGVDVVGPISADIIFREAKKGKYDLIIAHYHDQGHIPVKLLYFDQSVNVTLGVPFIRTSVDHGTAFDIAYKGQANAINMLTAILYALKMSNQ